MKNKITFEEVTKTHWKAKFNDKTIADIQVDDVGFFCIWLKNRGWWATYPLKEITAKCDELNADMEKIIDENFKKEL